MQKHLQPHCVSTGLKPWRLVRAGLISTSLVVAMGLAACLGDPLPTSTEQLAPSHCSARDGLDTGSASGVVWSTD